MNLIHDWILCNNRSEQNFNRWVKPNTWKMKSAKQWLKPKQRRHDSDFDPAHSTRMKSDPVYQPREPTQTPPQSSAERDRPAK